MNRRDFLKLMGVASSASLVSSCGLDKRTEKLISRLAPPEDNIAPGQAIFYNTTCTECPANCGLAVKVLEGSPVKLEGIPGHPINDGALCMRGQSSLTRLYHPERIRNPLIRDSQGVFKDVTYNEAYSQIIAGLRKSSEQGHKNLYLSGRTTGSFSNLIDLFCDKVVVDRLPEFEVYSYSTIREANKILFNKAEIPLYRIETADFLLTLGADIFETFGSPVSNAVQFARAKRQNDFRWFHIEPHVSLTGLQADERFTINPGSEAYLLLFLLQSHKERLPDGVLSAIPEVSPAEIANKTGLHSDTLKQISEQFENSEKPLLITGGVSTGHSSGLETAVLAGLIQAVNGMTGALIDFSSAADYANVGTMLDMEQLLNRLQNDEVGVIFIARTNPIPSLPSSFSFTDNLKRAQLRVGLSDFLDETMTECDIVLPLSHSLESWGDAQPRKGLKTLIRPVLEPLFDTLPEGDILLGLMREAAGEPSPKSFQEYLINQWAEIYPEDVAKEFLSQGYYEEATSTEEVKLDAKSVTTFLRNIKLPDIPSRPILLATPSIRTFDGRSRVLKLLSEIPDPLTTISYGQWISISEETAKDEKLQDGDEILISSLNLKLPVKIQPQLPTGIYMVQRDMLDSPAFEVDKRTGESLCYLDNFTIEKTGSSVALPILSGSTSQRGRGIISRPVHKEEDHEHEKVSLYPAHEHEEYRWAMVIDLALCIGCSACVAACYLENNIPVVGKPEHLTGREMSWIRIEPYYEENEKANFVPMLCQQCDNAPCEPVCPVYATYHNPEGLNAQIYNRCVGTRYCSNNCPYKVRRFNWFKHEWEEPLNRMLNPDIWVRPKGVMEKCTFCIQRIRAARDVAKDEARQIRDGEVIPACAQTCPTNAIVFGNILDEESRVYKLAHSDRAYRIFEHLGTEPAVYYLQKKVLASL